MFPARLPIYSVNLGYGCIRSVYVNLTVHPGIETDASREEFSHQRKGRKKYSGVHTPVE
jgi:hypothetical protein